MRWSFKELLPELSEPGRALVFCYACNLGNSGALSYQNAWPDYSSAVLLQTPSDGQFQGYWRQLQGYRVKGERRNRCGVVGVDRAVQCCRRQLQTASSKSIGDS